MSCWFFVSETDVWCHIIFCVINNIKMMTEANNVESNKLQVYMSSICFMQLLSQECHDFCSPHGLWAFTNVVLPAFVIMVRGTDKAPFWKSSAVIMKFLRAQGASAFQLSPLSLPCPLPLWAPSSLHTMFALHAVMPRTLLAVPFLRGRATADTKRRCVIGWGRVIMGRDGKVRGHLVDS